MPDLDDRVAQGLRDLLDRAPSDADVWVTTERYVKRTRHRRQLLGAGLMVAVVVAGTTVALRSTGGNRSVRVATTQPKVADPCPSDCIGQATADIDGDGRADRVGMMATPPLSGDATAHAPSRLTLRVAFANGHVADYEDSADWDASLVGAADVNGSGKAMIFYFNDTGASHHMGRILQWNGERLIAVKGEDGQPFTTLIDGYAMGGNGFRCAGTSFMTTTIGNGPADHWDASETVYRWDGDTLVKVADNQPIAVSGPPAGSTGFYVPPEYDQITGVHCAGLENKQY